MRIIRRRWVLATIVMSVVAMALLTALAIRFPITSDALRSRLIVALSSRLDAAVELERLSIRLYPRLQATGAGLTVRHRDHPDLPALVSVGAFTVDADLAGLWRRRIARVRLEGLVLNIPPGSKRSPLVGARDRAPGPNTEQASDAGEDAAAPSYARDLVIEELDAPQAQLVILRDDPAKLPRTWYLHQLRMRTVGIARAMPFETLLTNAVPPGQITASGSFGPWNRVSPAETPLDGQFTFDNADLGVFKGIAGTLNSRGTFGGALNRIAVDGRTDTPDFMITLSGHPVPLQTTYHAIVDATNGNTTLDPVNARLQDTPIEARGGVYEVEGVKGREVRLDVSIDSGRLEDVLRLAVKAPGPTMRGRLHLTTSLAIPPGDREVVEKLRLDGRFAIENGTFTNAGVQSRINELSQRARGETGKGAVAQVPSNFAGRFRLADARLALSALTFNVPGAVVRLDGQYHLQRETLAFSGNLHMDAKLSQTVTGFKSLLLKMADPFFRRNGQTVVPLTVSGTRNDPKFGMDVRRVFRRQQEKNR